MTTTATMTPTARHGAAPLVFALPAPDISAWRAGNTGTEGVWRLDSGQPGRHVMISALVHGNELCGAWALKGLLEAGLKLQAGSLTLAFCNLAAFDRFDAADHDASRFVDQDMNRQWSDDRIDAADTQERRRAAQLRPFVQQADWLLDLHSMHEPSAPLSLTGMPPRNRALARTMGAPAHVVIDAGHKDGTRMRDYGRFGLPDDSAGDSRSLLIECGFHGDPASRVVAQDQCVRFLVAAGTLSAAEAERQLPGWRQPDAPAQWALEVTGPVVAKSEHFRFTEPFTGLEVIAKAGTVIGWNAADASEAIHGGEPVATPYDDCVLVMPSTRQARAGVTVVRFAQRSPL
ncbi:MULTISPECIES: succinylglutamate desuccinylase/aspartoacylase family protein [unclassified Acidovorax]|uniref:succinylglutamate desuccinylase/aspartoacylase domain-containing protein n=1 Tax=unclassified Acidovorax TaxID=2684926 RepID=UPI003857A2C6